MAEGSPHWTVLEHGPLRTFGDGIREVEGAVPRMALRRRMVILATGTGAVVHSAIACDESTMAALEAWATPTVLVVPNAMHRLDAAAYKARYPDLHVVCPPGSRGRVCLSVPVDETLDTWSPPPGLRCELLDGTKQREAVFIAESENGPSLVFGDALFNVPHQGGIAGWVVRLMGSSGGPKMTLLGRLFLASDKGALRAHLHRLADLEPTRLFPGHGHVIEADAPQILRSVADAL